MKDPVYLEMVEWFKNALQKAREAEEKVLEFDLLRFLIHL